MQMRNDDPEELFKARYLYLNAEGKGTDRAWYFFDVEGIAHYYPTEEDAHAAARLVWD